MHTSLRSTDLLELARRDSRCLEVVLTLFMSFSVVATAAAQAQPRPPARQSSTAQSRNAGKWAVEVHGGVFGDPIATLDDDDVGALPGGTPFTTINGLPSRAVTSWVFGDGAALFDEIRRAFAATHGVNLPAITPLDGLMASRGATRKPSAAFGARFSRDLTSWLAAEFSFDRGPLRSTTSSEATSAIEATRASYTSAFQALLTTIPHTGGQVTVTGSTTGEASDTQTILVANALLSFVRTSRVSVHAIVGGGLIMNDASEFEARLQSNYQFRIFSTYPINESESVTIRFAEKKSAPAAVLGFGTTIRVAGNSGVRVDARVLASRTSATTTVDATNSRVRAAQFVAFPSITTPSLQFSTVEGVRTTLSGDPINGLVTYSNDGLDLRPQVTVGYFVRF